MFFYYFNYKNKAAFKLFMPFFIVFFLELNYNICVNANHIKHRNWTTTTNTKFTIFIRRNYISIRIRRRIHKTLCLAQSMPGPAWCVVNFTFSLINNFHIKYFMPTIKLCMTSSIFQLYICTCTMYNARLIFIHCCSHIKKKKYVYTIYHNG